MSRFKRITSNPKICGGEPCIKGTRVAVHVILDHLAAGDSFDEIARAYPQVSKTDIRAAVEYASFAVREEIEPLSQPAA